MQDRAAPATGNALFVKFESSSSRVKGLTFHPVRPWILASLHNGVIQLWNWKLGILICTFRDHDGPVRGIEFHPEEPIFVSGGDDRTIRLWNFKRRVCLNTFYGHQDYIRSVQFHPHQPWILSASDDQSVKIWDYKLSKCICTLTGHHHYVMCAKFHPTKPLVASASLDQSIRIWDISGVSGSSLSSLISELPRFASFVEHGVVKLEIDYHDRGVNSLDWSKDGTHLLSGSDDRTVRLWKFQGSYLLASLSPPDSDSKAVPQRTFQGHVHNVSAVIFHPHSDLMLSNSAIATFRRESDRYWCFAAHPRLNLLAAGHDSGLLVFKLGRERPRSPSTGTWSSWSRTAHPGALYAYDLSTGGAEQMLIKLTRPFATLRSLHYNPSENYFLLTSNEGTGVTDIIVPSAGKVAQVPMGSSAAFYSRQQFVVLNLTELILLNKRNEVTGRFFKPSHISVDAIFPAPPGYVLLRGEDKVHLLDIEQKREVATVAASHIKSVVWSHDFNYVAMYSKHNLPAPTAAHTPDPLCFMLARRSIPLVGYIYVCNRKFELQCTIFENLRIKTAIWDDTSDVLLYNTWSHLKYCLPNGDTGIISTVEVPNYLCKANGPVLFSIDHNAAIQTTPIETFEYAFKDALRLKQFDGVTRLLRTSDRICGQSLISYLQARGFPDVALVLERDDHRRFDLALESGNIEVALEAARKLKETKCWNKLAEAAWMQGNTDVVEMAYQQTRNFQQLSFLYLITGAFDKLAKMMRINEALGDPQSRFHNALYLGDAAERVKVLRGSNLKSLADTCEQTHGLAPPPAPTPAAPAPAGPAPSQTKEDLLLQFATPAPTATTSTAMPSVEDLIAQAPGAAAKQAAARQTQSALFSTAHSLAAGALLAPPVPILRAHNWPLLQVSRGYFSGVVAALSSASQPAGPAAAAAASAPTPAAAPVEITSAVQAWGGDDDINVDAEAAPPAPAGAPEGSPAGKGGWADDEDVDVPDLPEPKAAAARPGASAITRGPSAAGPWVAASRHPAVHALAGSFESACKLLQQHPGVANMEPLKPLLLQLHEASQFYLPVNAALPGVPALVQADTPLNPFTLAALQARQAAGLRCMTEGKFSETLAHFQFVLRALVLADFSKAERREATDLRNLARAYVTAVRLELTRRDCKDPVRALELAALFTHTDMQPMHMLLSLRQAMNAAYKLNNFGYAQMFGQRLLELNPPEDMAAKTRKIVQFCQANPRNEHEIPYDPRNPFVICTISMRPIYAGAERVMCAHCGSSAVPQAAPTLCPTCGLVVMRPPAH
ncbi:Coatomer subunit alpha (CopA) [Paratrimastix pyriformis]|uniref:Coatomer subunit alpha (CopA) n=1 Tax=Paratrimastix pyriformis TaxID=342808 RepID=A0ABQ8UL54_9EUKA|nr:Coatomer subunit alpha (CopA) [Paratrimastix pyriformis]